MSSDRTPCAVGGREYADLYVTTGVHKSVVEGHAGRLVVVRGLDVKGVVANALAG